MKYLVTALLLLTPFAAHGAEWLPLASPKGSDQFFYDASKLVIEGEGIAYWKKVVFKVPQPVNGKMAASALFRERIHCGDHTLQPLSHLYQEADGGVIEYEENKDAIAAPIIPDSIGDLFEQALCKLVRQKQEENQAKTETGKDAAKAPAIAEPAKKAAPPAEEKKGADGPIMAPPPPGKGKAP